MIEKSHATADPRFAAYNAPGIPRYYPYAPDDRARGEAHRRLHGAMTRVGVAHGVRGSTPSKLIGALHRSYGDKDLAHIRGDLKAPGVAPIATNVHPQEAFRNLLKSQGDSHLLH
jgi:hypothetical protein